ncbi:glycosyltransferase [Marinomonas sp. NPDC078689]|uniref:glycosyltransferase n=1 Tax=Marinomonas sp. NPDC078689 TaxID=3364147 RepID=UPI0037CC8B56
MKKILYVVSTLAKCGPTNQLFNIIKNQNTNDVDICVLTLSPEGENSDKARFDHLGVQTRSLGLSRLQGMFLAKKKLIEFVVGYQPNLIHSQGVRADFYLSKIKLACPWVITSRNFPPEDYLSRFGFIKGHLTVRSHLSALKRCKNIVSCSHAVATKLSNIGIASSVIQNGVEASVLATQESVNLEHLEKPIFVTAGSFIPRKNMGFLVDAMKTYFDTHPGSLVLLGDGPLLDECKTGSNDHIVFMGNVNTVSEYLSCADYFISSSLSEGLPNAVLEALSHGVPAILSDIESHSEMAREYPKSIKTFPLASDKNAFVNCIGSALASFDKASRDEARRISQEKFSDQAMSFSYQKFYENVLTSNAKTTYFGEL